MAKDPAVGKEFLRATPNFAALPEHIAGKLASKRKTKGK